VAEEIPHPLQLVNDWRGKPLVEWVVQLLMYKMFDNRTDQHGLGLLDHVSILMTEAHQQYNQILSIPSYERQMFIDAFKRQDSENENDNP
jgi:hypothetical protein